MPGDVGDGRAVQGGERRVVGLERGEGEDVEPVDVATAQARARSVTSAWTSGSSGMETVAYATAELHRSRLGDAGANSTVEVATSAVTSFTVSGLAGRRMRRSTRRSRPDPAAARRCRSCSAR